MTPGRRVHTVSRDLLLATVRDAGSIGRAELVRRTGMARVTVNALVDELLGAGLLVEASAAPGAGLPGRPARLLSLGPEAGCVAGAVIGADAVRVAVAGLTGDVRAERVRRDLDPSDPAACLDAVAALIAECVTEAGPAGKHVRATVVGLSAPLVGGVVQPSSVLPAWAGLVPGQELEKRLGHRVSVRNDADLSLVGEIAHGVASGYRDVCYLRVASGIGCGLLLGGVMHSGAGGVAGEIGHVQVDETGALCRCGNRGCLETIAAPREIMAALHSAYGNELTVAEAVELARTDAPANRILADAGRMIGRVVADLANTVNPALVVLDGPLVEEGGPVVTGVIESLHRYAQPEVAEATEVRAGALDGRAAILGAISAALAATAVVRGSRLLGPGDSTSRPASPARREREVRRDMITGLLRGRGATTRSDVVRLTKLPRAAVTEILDGLRADGVVEETDLEGARSGRPSPAFRLATPAALVAGISLTADASVAVIADGAGKILYRGRRPTTLGSEGRVHLRAAAELARDLLIENGHDPGELRAAGLSVPSPVHPVTGRFGQRGVLPMFAGFAPGEEIEAVLGVPVKVENNAQLSALAEARRGAAKGAKEVLYLRADQYTGAGIVAGGRMYRGAIGYAGEVGHLNVREVGPLCICGSRGCLSTYLNPAYFGALLERAPVPPGGTRPEDQLLALVKDGYRPAQRALADAGRLIGRSVAPLCDVLNPAVVVVGGRFLEAGPFVVDGIRESLVRHCAPTAAAGLTVVASGLRADSEVVGAVEALL